MLEKNVILSPEKIAAIAAMAAEMTATLVTLNYLQAISSFEKKHPEKNIESLNALSTEDWDEITALAEIQTNALSSLVSINAGFLNTPQAFDPLTIPPALLCCLLGFTSSLVYWNIAQQAAIPGTLFYPFLYWAYPIASTVYNALLNTYFINLELSAWLATSQGYFADDSPESRAEFYLNHTDEATGQLTMASALKTSVQIAASLMSGVPMFVIDLKNNSNPMFVSSSVYIAASFLCLAGMKRFIELSLASSQYIYDTIARQYSSEYNKALTYRENAEAMKQALLSTVTAAEECIRDQIQRGSELQLQPLYKLMAAMNEEKDLEVQQALSLQFLLTLNALATPKYIKADKTMLCQLLQLASIAVTVAASVGYYLDTVDSVAYTASLFLKMTLVTGSAAYWLTGSAFFLGFFVISCQVSWDVTEQLYDCFAYALSGIQQSWQNADSLSDFLMNFYASMFDTASWANVFRLSVAMKQNPLLTLIPYALFWGFSPLTAASSLFFNQAHLPTLANYLILPTIYVCVTFNSLPGDEFLTSIQQNLTLLGSNDLHKEQLKLQTACQNIKETVKNMTPERAIETGNILLASPDTHSDLSQVLTNGKRLPSSQGATALTAPEKRAGVHSFFGHQSSEPIFGSKHRFSNQEVSVALKQLGNEQVALSKQGFFAPCRVASNLSENDQSNFQHFMTAAC